jgi:hypothetical protein
LPTVFSWYELNAAPRADREVLLEMQNGSPFLTVQGYGRGKVYLLTAPLKPDHTNFPQHAIVVPTFFRIVLLSQPQPPLFYYIGKETRIDVTGPLPGGDKTFRIREKGSEAEFVPRQVSGGEGSGIFAGDQVREAGHYELTSDGKLIMPLAYNYQRTESRQDVYTTEELKDICLKAGLKSFRVAEHAGQSLTTAIQDINTGLRLWKLFIILALAFLAAEVLILRFWK